MSIKRKAVILLIVILTIMFTGCGKQADNDINEYWKLKDDFTSFVLKVYNPSNENDPLIGINSIKEYVTDELYDELVKDLGQYNEEIKTLVKELNVSYIRKENSLKNLNNKINITFRLVDGNRSQLYAIEFVENNEGKLNRYYIFTGIVEVK